jgi:hypothetical protein
MKFYFGIVIMLIFFIPKTTLFAQKDSLGFVYDSFFLSKKKGLLGRLGKSISADKPKPELTEEGVVKNNLPFNRFVGLPIRNIYIISLDLDRNLDDTTKKKRGILNRLTTSLHKKTKESIIKNNLFFKEGDKLAPYLLADNERYLRELVFIEDATISLALADFGNAVDVFVKTKDVFSIGGSLNVNSSKNFTGEIKEENFLGSATRLNFKALYDETRGPEFGYGGEIIKRNINGSFTDFTMGYKSFNNAFNSGRPEETYTYLKIEKPLVSPYMPFTGSVDLSWHKTANNYIVDTVYNKEFNYEYVDFDSWGGFNLGSKKEENPNVTKRIREFVAIRVLHHKFQQVPGLFQNTYNYVYANITGVLGAFNIFKQNFYKTKYIYGFGRQEDVPEGFSISFIGGWTDKQNNSRPYAGIDLARNYFSKKGNYFNYTIRAGGFKTDGGMEDVSLLFNLEHFSKLQRFGRRWHTRKFTSFGFTQQIHTILDQPLFLSSIYGLPELSNGAVAAQTRITLKRENVFYSKWNLLGFRFAPFVFANGCFVIPQYSNITKGELYSSFGGGLRVRNESLIFGTMEIRYNYFPRINFGMQQYRIDFRADLKFKYNSQYIKRPDFVSANG